MIMKNKIFPTLCLVWHMAVWFWSPASAAPQTFIAPPGGWTEITVSRGGEEIARPQNRHGHFSRLEVEPSDLLEITAAKSGLGPGVSIQLYTLHGGLIDGQVQTTLLTDEQGAVQFTFQLGPASGNYPLILRFRRDRGSLLQDIRRRVTGAGGDYRIRRGCWWPGENHRGSGPKNRGPLHVRGNGG